MSTTHHTTYSMIVAQLLNEKREMLGLSQSEFLQKSGLTQSSWSRINRGLSYFTLEELKAACRSLSTDLASVIQDAEQVSSQLPKTEGVEVVETTKAAENKSMLPTIIAATALAFLISRLLKK